MQINKFKMKKVFYSVVLLGLVLVAASSCNKNHNSDTDSPANIEARTKALGFSDVEAYQTSVAGKCTAGDHTNCDILADGTHQACVHTRHSGTKHDGTHHDGTGHNGTGHDGTGHNDHSGGSHHN